MSNLKLIQYSNTNSSCGKPNLCPIGLNDKNNFECKECYKLITYFEINDFFLYNYLNRLTCVNEDDGLLTNILGSILKQKTRYNSTSSLQNSLELNLRSAQAPQSFDIKNFRLPTEFLNCTLFNRTDNANLNNHTNKGVYVLTLVIVLVSLVLSLLFLFLIHLNLISNYGKFFSLICSTNNYFIYIFIINLSHEIQKFENSFLFIK